MYIIIVDTGEYDVCLPWTSQYYFRTESEALTYIKKLEEIISEGEKKYCDLRIYQRSEEIEKLLKVHEPCAHYMDDYILFEVKEVRLYETEIK